jgi:hypothetical protein
VQVKRILTAVPLHHVDAGAQLSQGSRLQPHMTRPHNSPRSERSASSDSSTDALEQALVRVHLAALVGERQAGVAARIAAETRMHPWCEPPLLRRIHGCLRAVHCILRVSAALWLLLATLPKLLWCRQCQYTSTFSHGSECLQMYMRTTSHGLVPHLEKLQSAKVRPVIMLCFGDAGGMLEPALFDVACQRTEILMNAVGACKMVRRLQQA